MRKRTHRRKIELALAAIALIAIGLVELMGVSRGVLVGLVAVEALFWVGIAVVLVHSGRLGRLGAKGARA